MSTTPEARRTAGMGVAGLRQSGDARGQVDFGIGHGKILLDLHILDHQAVEGGHQLGRRAGDPAAVGAGQKGKVLFRRAARKIAGKPRRHHRRGDAMARDIDRPHRDAPLVDAKAADQIAAHMARRADHHRHLCRAIVAQSVAQQRLLQLAGLDQIAFNRIVDALQRTQRLRHQTVLLDQFRLHRKNAHARPEPRIQFLGTDRLGYKIVGPRLQPAGDLGLFRFRGEQDEIAVSLAGSFAWQGAEALAELDAGHPLHHPVRQDDVDRDGSTKRQRLLGRGGFPHIIAPAAKIDGQQPPLRPAVVDNQNARRFRPPVGNFGLQETGLTRHDNHPNWSGRDCRQRVNGE
jgi:hypothetical protein